MNPDRGKIPGHQIMIIDAQRRFRRDQPDVARHIRAKSADMAYLDAFLRNAVADLQGSDVDHVEIDAHDDNVVEVSPGVYCIDVALAAITNDGAYCEAATVRIDMTGEEPIVGPLTFFNDDIFEQFAATAE
jgi:hypothetical protein